MRDILVIGIDPGTTLGYAILDIFSRPIEIDSKKEMSLSELITICMKRGDIAIVGTDKNPAPDFVKEFCTKTGARLVLPKKNLLVEEKKKLVLKFKKRFKNIHESDALASALYAIKKSRTLVKKIIHFAKKNNKEHIKNQLILLLLKNKEFNLKKIVEMIESDNKEEEKRNISNILKDDSTLNRFRKLYEKAQAKDLEIMKLEKKIDELESEMKEKDALINRMSEKMKRFSLSEKSKQLLHFKENRILIYEQLIIDLKKQLQDIKSENAILNEVINNKEKYEIAKRYNDLGKDFVLDSKTRVVFVENPENISEKSVEQIKDLPFIYIGKEPPKKLSTKLAPIMINCASAILYKTKDKVILDAKKIQDIKEKNKILIDIIEKYKASRKK